MNIKVGDYIVFNKEIIIDDKICLSINKNYQIIESSIYGHTYTIINNFGDETHIGVFDSFGYNDYSFLTKDKSRRQKIEKVNEKIKSRSKVF